MPKKIAILDLGTNTFHLLIAELFGNQQYRVLAKDRIFVKLAEEGIETIGPAPFERGLATLRQYYQQTVAQEVTEVYALATAALRTASNGQEFIQSAKAIGINIQLISGEREAELIHKGVLLALGKIEQDFLIMDIGGGSTEFILAGPEAIYWKQSFPIGAAVLKNRFHHQEPIHPSELEELTKFLNTQLQPLWEVLQAYPITLMVGASGSFVTVADLINGGKVRSPKPFRDIPLDQYHPLHQQIIHTNLEGRLAMPGMERQRAPMMPVASLLTDLVLEKAGVERLVLSFYALKEGLLYEQLTGSPPHSP